MKIKINSQIQILKTMMSRMMMTHKRKISVKRSQRPLREALNPIKRAVVSVKNTVKRQRKTPQINQLTFLKSLRQLKYKAKLTMLNSPLTPQKILSNNLENLQIQWIPCQFPKRINNKKQVRLKLSPAPAPVTLHLIPR